MAVYDVLQSIKWIEQVAPVKATGDITLVAVADGDTVTIDDGIGTPVVFEFDDDETVTGDNTPVTIGVDDDADAAALAVAIDASSLRMATSVALNVVDLEHTSAGTRGNETITENTTGTTIVVTGMAGGVDANYDIGSVFAEAAPEFALERYPDGSIAFTEYSAAGDPTQRIHSNHYLMGRLFDSLRAVVNGT